MTEPRAHSIAEVVASGLCIGCGLCESVTKGRVKMAPTAKGSLRPVPNSDFTANEEATLLDCCPGVVATPINEAGTAKDPIWGHYKTMRYAWAGDPDTRFKGATGGVLTALGAHLVATGYAKFIMHVMPDPDRPMRSVWCLSESVKDVIARAGSRYGPTAPLAGLEIALSRAERFAIIAKPCDLNAVLRYARHDPRIEEQLVMTLAMVCGGQSRLTKSQLVLDEFELGENELSLFRYRGHGNPGPTRVETKDGRSFEKGYLEQWEDEGTWDLETRCKFCPDALGEAADIATLDVWPGGAPVGEDEGFNGIITRTMRGEGLMRQAVEAGTLVLGEELDPRNLDDMQPHQVRKKQNLSARFEGLRRAGIAPIRTPDLRIDELGERISDEDRDRQIDGVMERIAAGRVRES